MQINISNYKSLFVFKLLCLIAYVITFACVYQETLIAIFNIWSKFDEAYGHGFLILSIALYLIYKSRHKIISAKNNPLLIACVPLVAFSFIWSVSSYMDIIVIQQLLLPLILLSVIALSSGLQVLKLLLFRENSLTHIEHYFENNFDENEHETYESFFKGVAILMCDIKSSKSQFLKDNIAIGNAVIDETYGILRLVKFINEKDEHE